MAYHHGDLRNALLEAAFQLVRQRGPVDWSLREVTRMVGVSPAAAYHYFADKNQLLSAVAHRGALELAVTLRAHVEAAPLGLDGARLVALARGYLAFAVAQPQLFRAMFGVEGTAAGDAYPGGDPGAFDVLEDEVDRLIDVGVLPIASRPHAAVALWAAVHGLTVLILDDVLPRHDPRRSSDPTPGVDELLERLITATFAGLADTTNGPPDSTEERPN